MRKIAILILLFVAAWLSPCAPAQAVLCGVSMNGTCFLRATGNLNAGATWSNSSGGATCSATCTTGPTAGDTLILDSASGSVTLTLNVSLSVGGFDESGTGGSGSPFTGTVTHNSGITLTDTGTIFNLASGATYTAAAASSIVSLNPTGTSTLVFTTSGKTFGGITINAATGATVQPSGNVITGNAGTVTLTQGIFDTQTNNPAINFGVFSSSNSNTRSILCGTGTWTSAYAGGTGTVWDFTTTTGLTLCGGSTFTPSLVFNMTPAGAPTMQSGGKIYTSVTYTGNGGNFRFTIAGAPTFTTLNYTVGTGAGWLAITSATTLTVTNAFALTATPSNPLLLSSDSAGGAAGTIHATAASTISWAAIQNITGNTSAIAASNSLNLGTASLGTLTVTPPSSGIINGFLLRRDLGSPSNDDRPAFLDREAA